MAETLGTRGGNMSVAERMSHFQQRTMKMYKKVSRGKREEGEGKLGE